MVGNNLTDKQLQEIVDKTILYADKDGDGKISYDEFCNVSSFNIVSLESNVTPKWSSIYLVSFELPILLVL